jgi:hypothetical protein
MRELAMKAFVDKKDNRGGLRTPTQLTGSSKRLSFLLTRAFLFYKPQFANKAERTDK